MICGKFLVRFFFSFTQASVREVSVSESSSSEADAEIPVPKECTVAGASILPTVVGSPALALESSTVVESAVLSPTSPWWQESKKPTDKPEADIPAKPSASAANQQSNVAAQPQPAKA